MKLPPSRRRLGRPFLWTGVVVLSLLFGGCDWYQFGGGPQHFGSSPEAGITAGNVNGLHQRWQVTLPSRADGAPAIVSGVQTRLGKKTLVFVTTAAGDVLAYDAAVGGAPIWQATHPAGTCLINNGSTPCYTTSSPAVDPALTFVYSYGLDGRVHKHVIGTGVEVTTGGWPVLTSRKPYDEKGSSALAVATAADGHSYLYVTHSGYPGDRGDYQGHVTTIDLAGGTARYFNALCSNQTVLFGPPPGSPSQPDCPQVTSGVWARSGVVYDPDTNKTYLVSGNGTYAPAQHQWGDSVLAINPNGTGNVASDPVDAYTPTNFQQLQDVDADLGSTAPAVLPTPGNSRVRHLGLQGGKDAKLRLLNLDDLSSQGGPGHLGGEVGPILDVPQGGGVLSAPTVWSNPADGHTWSFVTTRNGVSALRLDVDGAGNPSLTTVWSRASNGTNASALVANGVLFVSSNGVVIAFGATTGTPLWLAAIGVVHWQSPVLANGQLYAEDENAHLTAWSR